MAPWFAACLAVAAQAPCYGPGGPQDCEDFTYVGSLVEDVPWVLALQELELLGEQLEGLSGPRDACEEPLAAWVRQVELYFQPLGACLEFRAIFMPFYAMFNQRVARNGAKRL